MILLFKIYFTQRYNWSSNEQDIVDAFNLDQALIEEYKENPDEACLSKTNGVV